MDPEIKVLPDVPDIAHEAAERIVDAAERAAREGRTFSLALSGGSTPKALFELLATNLYKPRIKWPNVEVFFGDERSVPPDHADSNYRMARETLLSKVPIPGDNVYRMHGELDANDAARQYGEMLKDKFGDGGMDMILLGMGDDGHTASLFPGTAALNEMKHRAVGNYVEKLKTWRITLTAPFINRAREVLVLVSGASKAKRLAKVLEGPRDPRRLPIQLIQPTEGRIAWLVDAAAAGMHEE
jgi:6-phosphogluconolactonase